MAGIGRKKLFSCYVTMDDERMKAMKEAPRACDDALVAVAEHWHKHMRPKHFEHAAATRYGYAKRSKGYDKRKRFKPALVFSGSMRHELSTNFAIARLHKGVDLKMHARALNFVGMPNDSAAVYVKMKDGRAYPNMKREIKIVTEEETKVLAEVAKGAMDAHFVGRVWR